MTQPQQNNIMHSTRDTLSNIGRNESCFFTPSADETTEMLLFIEQFVWFAFFIDK